jgi:hypothetical protein
MFTFMRRIYVNVHTQYKTYYPGMTLSTLQFKTLYPDMTFSALAKNRSQSFDLQLKRQRCKNLQRDG